jgi:hypothetical protein
MQFRFLCYSSPILAETPGDIISAEPVPNSVAILEGMLLTAVRLYVHGQQD